MTRRVELLCCTRPSEGSRRCRQCFCPDLVGNSGADTGCWCSWFRRFAEVGTRDLYIGEIPLNEVRVLDAQPPTAHDLPSVNLEADPVSILREGRDGGFDSDREQLP